ncbi:MAG: lipoyl domain-containing protein [Planctomycetaceae bacterium]|nr:lipoyl domain-containing protein [Planctomycetaceae bacterium]
MNVPDAWTAIVLPELGPGDDPVRVSTWLVELEETVELGERLVDVLIPGISFGVSSPSAGVLAKIERPSSSRVKPGDVLGWLKPVCDPE